METVRINKYIADKGWASRREADTLIADGKILVNGEKAIIGQQINERDIVELVGKTKEKIYLAFYKGRGIITHSPDTSQGEIDISTKLTSSRPGLKLLDGVFPVGRLDKDSEGLMILTNDGRITGPLLNPEAEHEKEYEVRVDKAIKSGFIKKMAKGVDIEGYMTKQAKVVKTGRNPNGKTFRITLTEGKKHQIRRMCAALGYQVQSIKRVRIENIELGKLKPNQYRKLSGKELRDFLKTLGL